MSNPLLLEYGEFTVILGGHLWTAKWWSEGMLCNTLSIRMSKPHHFLCAGDVPGGSAGSVLSFEGIAAWNSRFTTEIGRMMDSARLQPCKLRRRQPRRRVKQHPSLRYPVQRLRYLAHKPTLRYPAHKPTLRHPAHKPNLRHPAYKPNLRYPAHKPNLWHPALPVMVQTVRKLSYL